jgi:hypothetical protein
MRLAHEFGLWDQPGVTLANPAPPSTRTCSWCTTRRTFSAVEAISRWAEHPGARDGLDEAQLRAARMFGWAPRTTRCSPACTRPRRW